MRKFMPSRKIDACSVIIENKSSQAEGVIGKILSKMEALKFSKDDIFAVHLGLEEAFINCLKHGNKSNPQKKITIEYHIEPEKAVVSLTDEGEGFKPDAIPDPTEGSNIYKTSGRGLFLIRSFMDKIVFNKKGNCICITKYNSNKAKEPQKRR